MIFSYNCTWYEIYKPANDRIDWISDNVQTSKSHPKVDSIFVVGERTGNTVKKDSNCG